MTRRTLSNHPDFLRKTCLPLASLILLSKLCFGQALYEFGNPSSEEQLYIEYANRARSNPTAEGIRLAATADVDVVAAYNFFNVNLTMMMAEMALLPASPPLAPNASLTTSSRGHSQWMLANAVQRHDQTNPSNTSRSRNLAAGFDATTSGENIYAYSKSVFHGHASFVVNVGPGDTGGMQARRGHRMNIHNSDFREIGVGVANGTNGAIGPQTVTQNIGTHRNSGYFSTGVAYYDLNSNNFYDIGEGLAGLTVNVSGATRHCITAAGGGWAIPLPTYTTPTNCTVTFTGPSLNQSINFVAPANQNAKADLKLSYVPPLITSPATAGVNSPSAFFFDSVPGISTYEWSRWSIQAAPAENCNNKANVTTSLNGSYSGLNTSSRFEGAASFQITAAGSPNSQFIMLNPTYYGGNNPSFSFRSRMGITTAANLHKVQFQELGSTLWQDCYTQAGGNTESNFSLRAIQLPMLAGKAFKLRFFTSYLFGSGGIYSSTGSDYGWMIDSINFSNISSLTNPITQTINGSSGVFTPTAQGNLLMIVTPKNSGTSFPASSQMLQVTSQPPPPTFTSWATLLEYSSGLSSGTLALYPNGDPDHDGIQTLIEYAFGSSPVGTNPPSSRMPKTVENETHYILRYQRDKSLTDIVLTAEVCADLISWKSPGQVGAPEGFTDILVSTSGNIETREVKVPKIAMQNCFMTIQVRRP